MAITTRAFCALATALLLEIVPASAFSPMVRYEARRWAPARATDAAVAPTLALDGVSPVPTEVTRQPDLAGMELFKRDFTMGADTCGFVDGYKSMPWTCYRVSATCLSTGSVLGCCVGTAPACYSTFITSCTNYQTSAICGNNDLCCPSTAQSCFTWLFSYSTNPGSTYSVFNCYTTGGTGTLVATPPGLTASSDTSSSDQPTSTTPSDTTSSRSPAQTTTGASSPAASSESSTNIGAIVGGAVGGVAVIGIVVVAIVWMVVRSRRAKAAAAGAGVNDQKSTASGLPPNAVPGFPPSNGSPSQMTVPPSSTMTSPQMSQAGGYFQGPTPPPPAQQPYGVPAVAAAAGPYGGYYEPPKPQPSPGAYSDPRFSMQPPQQPAVLQPQYTGSTPSNGQWSHGNPHNSMQPPPSELQGAYSVGSHMNPAQLG